LNPEIRLRRLPSLAVVLLVALAGNAYSQWIEDSIQVPGAWVGSLSYNSQQDELYGTSETGWIFIISCRSNMVTALYPLSGAFLAAYDSLDDRVYVTYHGTEVESLAVFDGGTHQLIKQLEMPGSTMPVWDRVSNRMYISCQTTNNVAVVDCATDSLLMFIRVGACPIKMYLNTLRHKLYVLNYDVATVSVIDLTRNQVIKTVAIGGIPDAGYYSSRQDKFYVSGAWDVAVLDGASDSVIARVPLQMNGLGYTEAEAHDLIMVAGGGVGGGAPDTVFVIDALTNALVGKLPVGREPWNLTWSAATDMVYCANSISADVTVFAGDGSRVIATLPIGANPFVLQPVPRHGRIYVGHLAGRWVHVIKDSLLGVEEPDAFAGIRGQTPQVKPNPFSQLTTMRWHSPGTSLVRVYGADGRFIRALPTVEFGDGSCRADWDGRDAAGVEIPPGVYCVRLASSQGVVARLTKVR